MPKVTIYGNELYHYGILGMKWGVRRYQNADGTLTPEGAARLEKHYYKSKQKISSLKKKSEKLKYKINKLDNKNSKAALKNKDQYEIGKVQDKINELKSKAEKYDNKAEKWIQAREKAFEKINYDSIPKEDIDRGAEYTNYVMALQSRNSMQETLKATNKILAAY